MVGASRNEKAGPTARLCVLVFLLGKDAKHYAPVKRDAVERDIESLAVGVGPRCADARPETFAVLGVADLVGDMGWRFGGSRFVGGGLCVVGHGKSPFRS